MSNKKKIYTNQAKKGTVKLEEYAHKCVENFNKLELNNETS